MFYQGKIIVLSANRVRTAVKVQFVRLMSKYSKKWNLMYTVMFTVVSNHLPMVIVTDG